METRSNEYKLSTIVKQQVPEFVRDQHPLFVSFLKAYYEWTELPINSPMTSGDGAIKSIGTLDDDRNIDRTLDEYVEHFRREYLDSLPPETLGDKALLIKHVKEFYRTKGTENSIKFLFRILYDENVEIYYPNRDLLRTCDGKWVTNYSIKVNNNISSLESTIVTTPTGSALIETVTQFQSKHAGVFYEVIFNKSSITGTFSSGQTLTGTNSLNQIVTATIQPIIIEPTITNGGSGYAKGDTFYLRENNTNQTAITTGKVKTISNTGAILTVKLDTYEINEAIFGGVIVDFSDTGGSNAAGAVGTSNLGALTISNGYYLNEDGQPSSTKKLQDNYYWQDFSYVLKSTVAIDSYFDLLQKSAHPAGMIAFAEVLDTAAALQSTIDVGANIDSSIRYVLVLAALRVVTSTTAAALTTLGKINEHLNLYTTTYGGMRITDFHGWKYRPINNNPYYPKLLDATPDTLIIPPRRLDGLAPYTPGSLITIV